MTHGFKATLFAGVMTLGVVAPAFAAAPVINDIPDVTIGDVEGVEANTFEYTADLKLNDFVSYDGDKSTLEWSFGESDDDGIETNEYTINGVGAAVSGLTNLANEASGGFLNTKNPTTAIDGESTTTTFRDIVLSPAGAGPFPDPSVADAALAATGKVITYYVSDGTDVASSQAIVRSVDDAFDSLTQSSGWTESISDTDFSSSGWVASGIDSDGVEIARTSGSLQITLTPEVGVGRTYGWVNNDLLDYNDVGAGKIVRGKFYVSTTNLFSAPTNEVPGFRLRLTNEGAVDQAAHFEYAVTALASPAHEDSYGFGADANAEQKAGAFLRPSDSKTTPSLYRLDFDPMDVPAAAGSTIGALMESYTYSDKANGTLSLHEVVLGTYDVPEDADGELIFEYDRTKGLAEGIGGAKALSGGAFNVEASFIPGRRQRLYLPFAIPGSTVHPTADPGPYGTNFVGLDAGLDAGLIGSTRGTSTDLFAMDLLDVQTVANADRVRVEPGKLYRARFYALAILPADSSDPNAIVQGNMRFRFQTAGGTVSYLYELSSVAGPQMSADLQADNIAAQSLPSSSSQNPDTDATYNLDPILGADGGWYTVTVPSPLDRDGIRMNEQADDTDGGNGFFTLGAEPGPGSAADSLRDVKLGVDLIQAPTHLIFAEGGEPVQFAQKNYSEIGLQAVKVYEYPSIDDGGYDFDGLADTSLGELQ